MRNVYFRPLKEYILRQDHGNQFPSDNHILAYVRTCIPWIREDRHPFIYEIVECVKLCITAHNGGTIRREYLPGRVSNWLHSVDPNDRPVLPHLRDIVAFRGGDRPPQPRPEPPPARRPPSAHRWSDIRVPPIQINRGSNGATSSWSNSSDLRVWKRPRTGNQGRAGNQGRDGNQAREEEKEGENVGGSQERNLRRVVLNYNRCCPTKVVSDSLVRYQMELWETTFFFSRNIVNFQFSDKTGHPLEILKDAALQEVKDDLQHNLKLVRTKKVPHNYSYVLLPIWRGLPSQRRELADDKLSAALLIDGLGFQESMLDDYVDFPGNQERLKLNLFLDALRNCVSFDGGLQHYFFNRGEPWHEEEFLPSLCPCGYLLGHWRRENNIVGRKADEEFNPDHPFPFCTFCDDGFETPTCYVHPNSLLRHLYDKASTCPLHLLTLNYLFRLYKHMPYVKRYHIRTNAKLKKVSWKMHTLEKQNSLPPLPPMP